MITEKIKELKDDYNNLRKLNVDGKATQGETNKANEVWRELFTECKPTIKEFNDVTNNLIVTTDVFYNLMKTAGFWSVQR